MKFEFREQASDCAPSDVEIVDPPYSDDVHDRAVSNNPGGVETGTHDRDFGFDSLSPELLATLTARIRAAKRWACVFTDIESVGAVWKPAAPELYVRSVPWVRWSQPQKSGDRPCSGCEIVALFHAAGRKRWNGPGGVTHLWAKSLRGKDKYSAEKPLDAMLCLVSWFSDPGELVTDACMGSGTTGVACELLGRSFQGAEIDAGVRKAAAARVLNPKLSDRDHERAERWVNDMLEIYETEVSATPKAKARRARGLSDVMRVAERLEL